jgi:hypothetical protein
MVVRLAVPKNGWLNSTEIRRIIATAEPYTFSFQRLMRWHQSKRGCSLLSVDRTQKLQARRFVVYKSRGFQKVWYFLEADLVTIRANLAAGRVVSEIHGPGCTSEEARQTYPTLTKATLAALPHWTEARVTDGAKRRLRSPDGHILRYKVYSPARLHELAEDGGMHKPATQEGEGISEREAMRRWPKWVKPGDCRQWREESCQWLGKKLHAWKVKTKWATPNDEGEWRYSAKELEMIVQRQEAAESGELKYPNGKTYLTPRAFRKLTGMVQQQVDHLRTQTYKSLVGRSTGYESPSPRGGTVIQRIICTPKKTASGSPNGGRLRIRALRPSRDCSQRFGDARKWRHAWERQRNRRPRRREVLSGRETWDVRPRTKMSWPTRWDSS